MYYLFLGATVLSHLLTALLFFFLRIFKAKQIEREEGPKSHKIKSGTPTMGGLGFITVFLILGFIFVDYKYFPAIFLALSFAFIGFLDDLIKILRKNNLGLTFRQKIIFQTLIAVIFTIYLINAGCLEYTLYYFIFLVFLIVGSSNAANLTDGLDGLLAGTAIIAFLSFGLICFKNALIGGAAFSFIFAGAILGFLFYNFPKARLFMGDVGSLAIGSALAGLAIIAQKEWMLALIGGVFIIETVSVIIQVISFKLLKKRVFKMSPLHHHFEMLGFSEKRIVLCFWLFQLILGIFGVMIG
ncbi:MAG: phospho-N-acetylmuramoyl-pentapeptide-transferase [Candidatus Saganbacteria bacterium]|uniref:Phospho-N-acetylmuramoyl-pentapeptide-transferase n=1 Tax=Candidatus Saganbacteria bacterium TaxID=2575572 RepID=A0A833L102_UNCSA|nr:MAG: phospho-N-acetylmuramoyl-pentapeptide-transferase [Candidatus Saganbacteria bacterium]